MLDVARRRHDAEHYNPDTSLSDSVGDYLRAVRSLRKGANGLSDIEGKAARVAANERGQRASFKAGTEEDF
jgi:hypothetical protein